jgi:hypothetical protein
MLDEICFVSDTTYIEMELSLELLSKVSASPCENHANHPKTYTMSIAVV